MNLRSEKNLTRDFIDLVLLNAILPLKYAFNKDSKEDNVEEILNFYRQITAEKNTIMADWKNLGCNAKNALDSQAMLYHYKKCCEKKDCLNCGIAYQILKKS